MKKCNIITTIISHLNSNRIKSCLNTWLKDIRKPNEYIIAGDLELSKKYPQAINLTYGDVEYRKFLFFKTYNTIKYVIENYDFKFWHKCDDDTYVKYNLLEQLLDIYDYNTDVYIGKCIKNPIKYALGFSYIISKPLLIKVFNELKDNLSFYSQDMSEDRVIGQCMINLGVDCKHIDKFICLSPKISPEEQAKELLLSMLNKETILGTIHKNSHIYMQNIHDKIKHSSIAFDEFIDKVNYIYDSSELELRYGQVIMNTLYQVWPEKYQEISHTEYDCFYEDGWTFATSQTLEKLRSEWKRK